MALDSVPSRPKEGSAEVSDMANTLLHPYASKKVLETGFCTMNSSTYETAWLAMLTKSCSESSQRQVLFPQCLDALLSTQEAGGGWNTNLTQVDGILSTGAATYALKTVEGYERVTGYSVPSDIQKRISNATKSLESQLNAWDVEASVNAGFEILVPAILKRLASMGIEFMFRGQDVLTKIHKAAMSSIDLPILYCDQQTFLPYMLEAFIGLVDFDRVKPCSNGSMMGSPSATAAYLIHIQNWNDQSESYLTSLVANHSDRVPPAYPGTIFEISWAVLALLEANIKLDGELVTAVKQYLAQVLNQSNGTVSFSHGYVTELDDTANTISLLNRLGVQVPAERMKDTFESGNHFSMFVGDPSGSVSVNCNALKALLEVDDRLANIRSISKIVQFLVKSWNNGSAAKDKWHLSQLYMEMHMCQALVKLVEENEKHDLSLQGELLQSVYDILPQLYRSIIDRQSGNGSIGSPVSTEVTSFGILALTTLARLPLDSIPMVRLQVAIKNAKDFVWLYRVQWSNVHPMWVGKCSYRVELLSQALSLAALNAS